LLLQHGTISINSSELQSKDLEEYLPEVEKFALDEFIPALVRGGFVDDQKNRNG
jgi:hypothetical protein